MSQHLISLSVTAFCCFATSGNVYLDHAGATMYSSAQLQKVFMELNTGMFGNPHSHAVGAGPQNESTTAKVERVKRHVMRFFSANEEEYELIFTSGATAALKLVGECFPWQQESRFAYSMDSHTSVLGIRGYATKYGASSSCISLDEMKRLEEADQNESGVSVPQREAPTGETKDAVLNLFAFPAECNFSGSRHPLSLVKRIRKDGFDDQEATSQCGTQQQHKWLVLLDAAKFVSTHRLDLSVYTPDFVVCSFYKMFGYPTGLGALLVKKSALPLLEKAYYGGGTVQSILASQNLVIPRGESDRGLPSGARFADGTQSFLSIMSLRHGLDQLERLSMSSIENHTAALTRLLYSKLAAMKHWNNRSVCEVYGNHSVKGTKLQGPIVACNFFRPDGSYVGYSEVSKLAAIHNIQLRAGCFCNPGACQSYLQLRDEDLLAGIKAGHVCGDGMDVVNGLPTGAVRLSIGYMTSFEDIVAFTDFVTKYFVSTDKPLRSTTRSLATTALPREPTTHAYLRKITLFPIKSCGGMIVDAWPVGSRGLLFDREWAIVDVATNKAFSLKELPELCFVHPVVDLKQQTLTIAFRGNPDEESSSEDSFVLPLHADIRSSRKANKDGDLARDLKVCTDACKGRDVGGDVSQWLSSRLNRQCAFVRVATNHLRDSQASHPKRRIASHTSAADGSSSSSPTKEDTVSAKIGFANQAQYLLISNESIADFNVALRSVDDALEVSEDAFRANFIVDGCRAFEEDTWARIRIGGSTDSDDGDDDDGDGVTFDISGACSRCSMINIDPKTGFFNRAPLQVLSKYRRERSNIFFGQFLTRQETSDATPSSSSSPVVKWVHVHDRIAVEVKANIFDE